MLDSSLFFIKGFLQLLLHHFKQLSEKLDDLRVNRIAYSYCNFYHRPGCLILHSRKSFPAQHDWLPSNTCKRYCPGYISDMPARKTSMATPNLSGTKLKRTAQHRTDKVGEIKPIEDLTSILGKDWREILNGSKIWCIVNFFYLTKMRWTWITWHCESKFTSWRFII